MSKKDDKINKDEEDDDDEKMQLYNTEMLDLAAYSTVHGVPHLFKHSHLIIIKLIWLVFILISWACCFYFIVTTLIAYYENNLNVNMES